MTNQVIAKFLSRHLQQGHSGHFSHVSSIRPMGRFLFDRDHLEPFWKLYCDQLTQDPDMICGLAEMPQEYSMLVVDVDLNVKITSPEEEPRRLYTYDQVEQLIQVYQEVMEEVTKDISDEHYLCILLEKPPYIDRTRIKSGFHLAFVNYFCSKAAQDVYISPKVAAKVDELNLFAGVCSPSSNALDLPKRGRPQRPKPWMLYGARKNLESGAYRVTKLYDYAAEEITPEEFFSQVTVYDEDEEVIEFEREISYYYPRILSVNPYGRPIVEVSGRGEVSGDVIFRESRGDYEDDFPDATELTEKKLAEAQELMRLLSPERAEDRNLWIEVGWVLYCIGDGSKEALDLWVHFSAQNPEKFDESVCLQQWGQMYRGSYTLGSLHHFAEIDSPEEYQAFQKKRCDKHLQNVVTINQGNHYDLALALKETYGSRYVCASLKPKIWYRFHNHCWEVTEEGIDLRKEIANSLIPWYTEIIKGIYDKWNEKQQIEDHSDDESIKQQIKAVNKILSNLRNTTFKNSVLKECEEVFYDGNFLKKLGKNRHMICFQNGVYDLKEHIFRDGKPEDYMTLQMPINYREFDESDPWVIELESYFEKVFPDRTIREYFLDWASEIFIGGNPRKRVPVWSGTGDNAKSITIALFQEMLGPYAVELPTNAITGPPPKAGAAYQELARVGNGVRLVFCQEPNHREEVNTGSLKKYSGNDRFFVRGIYEKGGEVLPMFKLVLICNNLPRLPCDDPAVWNRIRVIPYESTFTDQAPEDADEQLYQKRFPKDPDFAEKIPHLAEPLAWMLLRRLQDRKKTICEPEKVLQATEHYRKVNDVFMQFISEKLVPEEKSTLSLMEFWVSFREWHRNSFPNFPTPTKMECQEYLLARWGNIPNGGRWKGWRLRTLKDDVEAGNAQVMEKGDLAFYGSDEESDEEGEGEMPQL